jgi:beta-glucanase (GH16 family)
LALLLLLPGSARAALDLCHFRPVFAEDFSDFRVSAWGGPGSRWIAHTPWAGDFGAAAFADPHAGFPFRVHDHVLSIAARRDLAGRWRSGLIASADPNGHGFAQRFGYFEMRAKLPAGPGVWPAFWLVSNRPRGDTAPSVEIDVMEYYGVAPGILHNVLHVWNSTDPARSRGEDHPTAVTPGLLSGGFHRYGADVEPDFVSFYFDRREIWRAPTPAELTRPLMILADLALGGGWPIEGTANPSVMQITDITAYRREPGPDCH